MELLKLMERADGVFSIYQTLGSLAETRLDFKVLFEIISTHLVVDAEQVVELFALMLEVFPYLRGMLSRHLSHFAPFRLQRLERLVVFVNAVRICHHLLYLFDNGELLFKICLTFCLYFSGLCGTLFLNDRHQLLELCFERIGFRCKVISVSTSFDESLTCCCHLFVVHFVEGYTKVVAEGAVSVAAFGKFFELGHGFFLRGGRGCCGFCCLSAFLFRTFSGHFNSGLHRGERFFCCCGMGCFNFTHSVSVNH